MKIDKLDRKNVRVTGRKSRMTYLSEDELMEAAGGDSNFCGTWDPQTLAIGTHNQYPRSV